MSPEPIPDLPEGPPTLPGPPRGSLDLSRTFPTRPRLARPVPDFPEGPSTRTRPTRGSPDPSPASPRDPNPPGPHRGSLNPGRKYPRVPRPVPHLFESLLTLPRSPRVSLDLFRISPWVPLPVPDLPVGPRPVMELPVGPPTRPGPFRGSPDLSPISPTCPRLFRGSPDPSRNSLRVHRPVPVLSDLSQTSPRVP